MATCRSSGWVALDYDQGTGLVRVEPDDLRPGDLQISASQLSTYRLCPRKWWLEKVARLPRKKKPHFEYGTTLHECFERVVLGEETFPEGWDAKLWEDEDSDSVEEQARQIRAFVEEAIRDGVVSEGQGVVEGEIRVPVLSRDETPEGQRVDLVGYVDLELPNGIRDYKTAKTTRYVKSSKPGTKKYLGDDGQCLIYGYEWLLRHPDDDQVYLEHLTFVKEDGSRKNPNCSVPRDRVEGHWEQEVRGTAFSILETRKAEDWQSIPDPDDTGACFAYGGCEHRPLCGGVCNLSEHRRNLEKAAEQDSTTDPGSQRIGVFGKTSDQGGSMGLKDKIAARKNGSSSTQQKPAAPAQQPSSGAWAKTAEAAGIEQPPAAPAPAPEAPATTEKAPETTETSGVVDLFPKKQGKPAKSFDLYINVLFSQTTGMGPVVDLNQIHFRLAQELEKKVGKAFYEIDAFKRRDWIAGAARGKEVQEQLKGKAIVALDPGPDLKALIEALKPLANCVAEGCR